MIFRSHMSLVSTQQNGYDIMKLKTSSAAVLCQDQPGYCIIEIGSQQRLLLL